MLFEYSQQQHYNRIYCTEFTSFTDEIFKKKISGKKQKHKTTTYQKKSQKNTTSRKKRFAKNYVKFYVFLTEKKDKLHEKLKKKLTDDECIGGVSHLPVESYDDYEEVPDHTNQYDDCEYRWN